MRSTWKRVLSALLTIAMIATLLVVPAAAADPKYTYEVSSDGYTLTVVGPGETQGAAGTFGIYTFANKCNKLGGYKMDSTGTFTMKNPVAGTLTLTVSEGDGRAILCDDTTSVSATNKVYTFENLAAVTTGDGHTFKQGKGSGAPVVTKFEFTPAVVATTYAVTAASTTNGTVQFKVGGGEAADTVNAAEGDEVTVVAAANEGYKVESITTSPTLSVTDNKFTMPAQAVTVTVTFAADSRSDADIVADVVADVKATLKDYSAVAQADVNTETAAKTAVEAKLTDLDKQNCTVAVSISNLSAATAGNETNENGTNGSFTYTVTVTKGSASDATATGNVTITATPKEYTQTEAKNATLAVRKNTMKGYGGGTAATVFTGAKVVPADVMKALDDALTEAQAVAEASKTSAEYGAAIKALKQAEATFKAAVEDITETGTKAAAGNAAKGLYVMEADAMYAAAASDTTNWTAASEKYYGKGNAVKAGTNNYFSVKCVGDSGKANGSRLESSPTAFVDGYAPDYRLNLNKNESGNNVITFTVTNAPATMKIYWGSNNKAIQLDGSTVVAAQPKNIFGISTVDIATAGAKTLSISGGGNYIYRVEVQETMPAATDAPEFATNGDVCQMESKTDVTVMFKLNAEPATNTVFKLYDAETGGNQLGQNAGVTAGANNNITFTLQDSQKPTGTEDLTWYVTATAPDTAESERVAVTVKPYIPVTKVTLAHMGEGDMVGHVLYEKLKDTDEDVIGSQETNPSYANGWVLQAVVEPENATNKEVVFSNARETPEFIEVEEDGTVKAIKAGTGRIRVTSVGDPEQYAAVEITVKVRIGAVDIQAKDGSAAPTELAMGETLELGAAVTASASASASHQAVTWSSDDSTVATVSTSGVVTPLKTGTVTITATSDLDENIADHLTLTVTQGTPELKLTSGNPNVTSEGTVRFKLAGVPQGVTPTFTVKQGATEVNTVEVKALENDENYNYYAVMPKNDTGATVTYTVTASVAESADWAAAEASVDVGVLDENVKNILIKEPGTAKAVELVKGQTAELKVVAVVNGKGGVKDDAATAALTYAWTKDGEAMSDTTYTVTVDAAGEYICTVTSTDAAVETKSVTVTFTVTEVVPPMTAINVTADGGVDYTPATGALKITGPVAATFTVTTAPEGNEDTVATPTSSVPSVARVSLVDGKLTITPWSVGSTVITLHGTKATDVVKTINVTVVKAAAPAALTASDYTVTQPTAAGGKGTITITQNAPAGTEYVYRLGDSGAWIKFPASKSVELEPGVYKIRVYVPQPELQETTDGVAVEIKAATAAPSVDRVVVSSTASTVKVGGTVQMTAQVHMSNNTVSATEKVIWSTSDANVATVSATGLVTGVKAGVVTVTATSVTDNTKKGSKTLTVTEEQGVDKATLAAAITAAEGVYAIGDDVKVLPAGTKTGTVTKGQKFVTADKLAALEKAIADAKAVLADENATQEAVAEAVTTLNAAKDAMKVLTGTKGSTSGRPSSRPSDRDPGNTQQPTGLPFTDVKAEDWFFDNVKKAFDKGLMKGVEAERFAPSSNTTRAMVATVLFRMDGEKKTDVENLFNDVAADSWFTDAVAWAAGKGIVKGYDENTFAPDDSVTREQLVAMLYRYAAVTEKSEKDLSAFTDAASVSEWAAEAMTWAVEKGIILGRGNGQLDPQGLATRAEVCAVLVRFLEMK